MPDIYSQKVAVFKAAFSNQITSQKHRLIKEAKKQYGQDIKPTDKCERLMDGFMFTPNSLMLVFNVQLENGLWTTKAVQWKPKYLED
ncbi:MAG: hypothetical protein DRJ03_01175 [Chloroflexi bacterium]|nr:MAG: hypothetical protein DRJ03_01175 [Chloroflexota bacterium]